MPSDPARGAESSAREAEDFFGAYAEVGKTHAMLANAREALARNTDIVAGALETHGRSEVATLMEEFERIPLREVPHKGTVLRELDLDAALARKPTVL